MTTTARRRGSVLVVALGLLAVLAVFAVAFVSLVRLEARAAANTTDAARARLVAEAGVERALFLLTRTELQDPVTSFHAPWTYRSQDGANWGIGLPLEAALNPSFRAGRTPEGLAYSGVVSGTYQAAGDHFALRVTAANAKLSLNGQQPTLADMLDALGRAVDEFDRRRLDPASLLHDAGWAAWLEARRAALEAGGASAAEARRLTDPRDPVAGRGRQLVELRAALGGRFQALEQLRAVLPPEDLERLADHVTVDAWLDPAMVGFDGAGVETPQWRAPVDVNTAPWPVLVACFEGVRPRQAVHPDETPRAIDAATARRIATRLDQRRRGVRSGGALVAPGEPLRGWADLRRFLDADEDGDGSNDLGLDLTQRAALLANADPNLIHPQRNPDATNHPGLGKVDLAVATTELCFITYGVYEVTSLGRVLAPDGALVAQHTVHAVAQVYDTLRLLTQADFEAARTSDELEKTASFPNPVRAVTGSYRVRTAADEQAEVVFEPLADADLRRRLRVQAASRTSGWVQLIADEPTVPRPPETLAGGFPITYDEDGRPAFHIVHTNHMHLFRFGADLRGEVWRLTDAGTTFEAGGYTYKMMNRERMSDADGLLWDDPLREGVEPVLLDRVQAFAVAAGAPPEALGLDPAADPGHAARWRALEALAAALHPPGGRTTYAEDLAPDGLLVHPDRRGDLRYGVIGGTSPVLTNRGGVFLWFKLNHSLLDTWTPLLEAWYPTGGDPPPLPSQPRATCYKAQVEARLVRAPGGRDSYHLEVRSRRWSEASGALAPQVYWDPDERHHPRPDDESGALVCPCGDAGCPAAADPTVCACRACKDARLDQRYPEAEDFNAPYYSRHVRLELDAARAGEWHYLYLQHFANLHFLYVDGLAGEQRETIAAGAAPASWPLPAWPADLRNRVAPGGFVWPGAARPRFAEATLDELLTIEWQLAVRPPRQGGNPYSRTRVLDLHIPGYRAELGFVSVQTRRYTPWGPDHAGSFTAELPAFDADRVKVGRVLWTELQPRRWGLKHYDGGDFQSQGAYRWSSEAQRDHLSGRAVPSPAAPMMNDEYVRYWRLVYLAERAAAARAHEERYARLLDGAAPEAAPTLQEYRDAFAGEVAALEAERGAILSRWGDPAPPADAGASIAFGADTAVVPGERRVRLRIDFLYFDRAQQGAAPPIGRDGQEWWQATALNVSPILDDVIVPYQERPRLLRRWDE
ncbi:MAG: hypothetical protein M9894_33645 [Planctomycetes bacterium]|nr:hypothetical protein [Planctomycetota bacterium]